MKRIIIALTWSAIFQVSHAQGTSSYIYTSDNAPSVNVEFPQNRTLVGGTIIKPQYMGNINKKMKNAFEYACRLWEEKIPTTYPLKFGVSRSNLGNNNILARITANTAVDDDSWYRAFEKRVMQSSDDFFPLDSNYFDELDAMIEFNTNASFDYNTLASDAASDKYDFITTAIQCIFKALGFSATATLNVNNSANLFMQPIIAPGNAIRNIGDSVYRYVGTEEWVRDRSVTVGGSGTPYSFYGASTTNVIPYAGNSGPSKLSNRPSIDIQRHTTKILARELGIDDLPERYWDCYWEYREKSGLGKSVLQKDGSFEYYDTLTSLTANEALYARTVDGYLRIKNISISTGFQPHFNRKITYGLYSYLPQHPDFGVGEDIIPYGSSISVMRSCRNRGQNSNYLVEVPIEFCNTEGCDYIVAEQTDSDWPIPYYTYVDCSPGYYYTIVDTRYPSTVKLYYENDNGETEGDTIIINLSGMQMIAATHYKLNVTPDGTLLRYNVAPSNVNEETPVRQLHAQYSITNVATGMVVKEGILSMSSGSINVATIPVGTYVLSVQAKGQSISAKWTRK